MQIKRPRTHWMLLLCVLFVTPVLAGCFGGDDSPKTSKDDPGDGIDVDPDGNGPGPTKGPSDHSGAGNDPSAHYHHYWGLANGEELEKVKIYDGGVRFNNYDTKFLGQNTLAWAEFGLESDADDVSDPSGDPIQNDMADTVFAGTGRITVTFPDDFPAGVSAMGFQYKPSNTPIYFPETPEVVRPGQTYEIKLDEVGMADPPHQFTASRWKFRLFAMNQICSDYGLENEQCPPGFIQDSNADPSQGSSTYTWGSRGDGVVMVAYNGGQQSLDPPHPDFWKNGDSIALGTTGGEITDPVVFTPVIRERVNEFYEIAMPPNNIVPLGTERTEVRVKFDNTAPTAEGHQVVLRLYYHGADDIRYVSAGEPTADGEWDVYDIFDGDGLKVDPPYESNSFWRFKLVPATVLPSGDIQENMGVFSGSYEMEFIAHKRPDFVLT